MLNKISVLITNFNKEKYLKNCLKKVTNQDYKNFEIILFDDCSSDGSCKIFEKFKNVKVIYNDLKKFPYGELNQINGIIEAFKRSTGSIICLLDADDFFLKNKLKLINQYFEKNKQKKIVFDFPKTSQQQFIFKNKMNKKIWPTIFPTSCISIRRKFFLSFLKHIYRRNFNSLEIDARITIFFNFYYNEYNVIKKKLTNYCLDPKGITSEKKKFSKKWWIRRSQAFEYMKIILRKKNRENSLGFDYTLTKLVSRLLKIE